MLYCTLLPPAEILRTLPGFPGLLLLGLTFVWAKRSRRSRLGLPIGLHAGLGGYYIINVGQLVEYSGQVPDWLLALTVIRLLASWAVFKLHCIRRRLQVHSYTYQPNTSEVDARQVSTF